MIPSYYSYMCVFFYLSLYQFYQYLLINIGLILSKNNIKIVEQNNPQKNLK